MPLYAYRCTECGHRFELIQHFDDEPEQKCPKCNGVLERPLTTPAFQFKGSGFYVTDYAGKSSAPASESAPAPAAPPCAANCSTPCPAAAAASGGATN